MLQDQITALKQHLTLQDQITAPNQAHNNLSDYLVKSKYGKVLQTALY